MRRPISAFTLVELLVSMTILTLMLVILLQMTGQTSRTWRNGAAKAEQFSEARKAFETMTGRIASATLNTYWDYAYDPNRSTTKQVSGQTVTVSSIATDYVRQSDLRFRVAQMYKDVHDGSVNNSPVLRRTHGIFFQAPFGMVDDGIPNDTSKLSVLNDLLNSWGYYVETGNTNDRVPSFLASNYPARYRARLMEFGQSSEAFTLYKTLSALLTLNQSQLPPGTVPSRDPLPDKTGHMPDSDDTWFTDPINSKGLPPGVTDRPVRVLAENILALIILPRLSPEDELARQNIQNYALLSPNFRYHSKQTTNYRDNPAAPTDAMIAQSPDVFGPINPKNQLPPVVQVAMFAIDEASAANLERNEGSTLGLPDMLKDTSPTPLFYNAADLETSTTQPEGGDLKAFENELIKRKLSYRLFSSNIAIKGAKWSTVTTK